ncbi:sensor histidine kinase [Enterovirga rhinocerotis]|uniref:histidine kinase n=1 Tax=Enterovirga rhinocerotis TaxID=1339210 RepID=A0A4R7BWM2_9HYPH|nr:ATP-binding protein [Enterovirga rhinocerotis]TDR89971.1 HAMP domain-containing protein [Enterovirga rhinocerotis]
MATGISEPALPPASHSAPLRAAVRRTSIRWRIIAIAVINSALAVVLLMLIWNGAQVLAKAWADVQRVRESERFLTNLDGDAERLQSLIHRYFAQSEPAILEKIVDLRDLVTSRLRVQARLDPLISAPAQNLTAITERLIAGFDELRQVRTGISLSYSNKIVGTARDMADLYASLAEGLPDLGSMAVAPLDQSREAYNAMVLAANAFYLTGSPEAAREARGKAEMIRRTAPDLFPGLPQTARSQAMATLAEKADIFDRGIQDLGTGFQTQSRLLREAVDGSAEAMSSAIDAMKKSIAGLERSAQNRFDQTLQDVALKLAVLAVAFVVLVGLMGMAIARSISEPLGDLSSDMRAITSGQYDRRIKGLDATDEIGEMARVVDVFRGNAIAKRQAEDDLLAAKEKAEASLAEIRAMQTTLIEAEKLAALGGLVAGVAHEVNNPVGISLTVASSLQARSEAFSSEVASGALRKSRLEEFILGTKLAASQLVSNLQRAAELIQSFKQVAVDRSQAERRSFDLKLATDQILASLRPVLRSAQVRLVVDIPDGIVMDSFPGPLGQIVTNLLVNAMHHAFPEGHRGGSITIVGRLSGADQVRLVFRDDGRGMSEEVQRQAFDPFFTTRRGSGGTGLGLHIVYNLVTQRLGGRIVLSSAEGAGTSFLVELPLQAPDEDGRGSSAARTPPTRLDDAHAG